MTSGQYSPMTPKGFMGTTAPYGNVERSFDLCKLAEAAGATYVARGTSYHAPLLMELIEQALLNRGFSVVEALTQCPTYFGRKNKMGGPVEMLDWIKNRTVNVKAAAALPAEKLEGKLMIGELYRNPQPEYCDEYGKVIAQVQRKFDGFRGGVRGCEQNSD